MSPAGPGDPHERLKVWFADLYNKEQFRLSMGEIRVDLAGFNSLLGFLAQGVALAGYAEDKYVDQLVGTHDKLSAMIEDLSKAGFNETAQYHYSLILGSLIERALEAISHLHEEDHGDQAL